MEFAGALCVLADKAYPKWPADQIKEVLRNQFIHGIQSSSIQLKLMKEMPKNLDEALQLATQQESVKKAQKRLHKKKYYAESLSVDQRNDTDDSVLGVSAIGTCSASQSQTDVLVQELSRQLQKLTQEVSQLQERTSPTVRQTVTCIGTIVIGHNSY